MKRHSAAAALLICLAMVLTACTGFQTTGEVSAGKPISELPPPDLSYEADGPQPDAGPLQIVQGFIRAANTPNDGWQIAKTFLAPDYVADWNPSASTFVEDTSKRVIHTPEAADEATPSPTPTDDSTASINMTVSILATVNERGVYRASDPSSMPWKFQLAKQSDGQWRITDAPPGILIDRASFEVAYDNFDLWFFDPTYSFLVPDSRWYPRVTAVRDIVNGLIAGASPWLKGAVASAVPAGARAVASIPVDASGTATVTLSGIESLESEAAGRLKLQLSESLRSPSVRTVQLFSDSREVVAPPATVAPPSVNARPLVMTEAGLGYEGATGIDKLDIFDRALAGVVPVAIEASDRAGEGVAKTETGEVIRLSKDRDRVTVDVRDHLINPTIGPFGDIWTVPSDRPDDLLITMPGGPTMELPVGLSPTFTSVTSMQVSRDGTRLAVAGANGTQNQLYVFGIIRDAKGMPTALGPAEQIRELRSGAATSLSWLSSGAIGLVVPDEKEYVIIMQPIGAPSTSSRVANEIVTISGSTDTSSVWILAKDGTLYSARGTGWAVAATQAELLARQQGQGIGTK